LLGEIHTLLADNSLHVDKINKLKSDLNVYQRAFSDVNAELDRYKTQMLETEKQKEDLEARLKVILLGHRVVTLIDGDGAIFSKELIVQGQAGGLIAAQKISDSLIQHLSERYGSHQYQLWVYVFLNKKGLMETLGRLGSPQLKNNFEDFVTGFNQAAERFSMLDVGNAKEAADAKIKCCHDNGYVTNLRSQITAGYKNKLILLKSYAEMASGIAEMDLPILTIPDLFIAQKLGVTEVAASRFPSYSSATIVGETKETNKQIPANPQIVSPPTGYSSVTAVPYKRDSTPDLDFSEGSTSGESDYDDDLPHNAVVAAMASPNSSSQSFSNSRYINPNIVECFPTAKKFSTDDVPFFVYHSHSGNVS
ncbi:hypothetical protein GG344DRAFT_49155, partial [Lentinula edodes]